MSTEREIIKGNLRALRNERALRQRQVAEGVGVSMKAYQSWEEGRAIPNPTYVKSLMTFFGVGYADIMERQTEPEFKPIGVSEEFLTNRALPAESDKLYGEYFVYGLFRENKLIYIGITKHPHQRRRGHRAQGRKFEHFKIWRGFDSKDDALKMERHLTNFMAEMLGHPLENVNNMVRPSWSRKKRVPFRAA